MGPARRKPTELGGVPGGFRMKSKALACLALAVVIASLLPTSIGHAAPKGKKSAPMVVGKDEAGDWGCNAGACDFAPLGAALGQDLVQASIGMADPKTINFIIGVDSLPPWG